MACARLPFGAKLIFAADVLRKSALMGDILRCGGAVYASAFHLLLDVLAPARKRHHLLASVTLKLPAPVGSGDIDAVSEIPHLVRKLRSGG